MNKKTSEFTGRRRNRTTSWSVRLKDILAQLLITAGGIGTILAVLGVCVFLVWVVVPLFSAASLDSSSRFELPAPNQASADSQADEQATLSPVAAGLDEYQLMTWVLQSDGSLQAYRNVDGSLLLNQQVVHKDTQANSTPVKITAAVSADTDDQWMLGLSDGRVFKGTLGVSSRLIDVTSLPERYREFQRDEVALWEGENEGGVAQSGLIQRVNADQFRISAITSELEELLDVGQGQAIVHLDFTVNNDNLIFVAATADGSVVLEHVTSRRNILTGKVTIRSEKWDLPVASLARTDARPHYMLLSGLGDMLYLAWRDGRLQRYDIRNPDEASLVEEVDMVPEEGQQLTALSMLLGRSTLLAGDSLGRVRGWFRVRPEHANTSDGQVLVMAHQLATLDSAIVTIARSMRTRIIAVGTADGQVQVVQTTSHKQLAHLDPPVREPVTALIIGEKDDSLLVMRGSSVNLHQMDVGYPETTMSSMFLPVWYENFNEPETTWQSSGGSDSFESKYGLWPLIFGSLKGAVYSLLFGVPMALLGAIFTSEFLSKRAKAVVKPTIEMMASLPSVVLGFLAALVIAPVAEQAVPAMLASFVVVPTAFLAGSFIWQLLPYTLTLRLAPWRLIFVACFLPVGIIASYYAGPVFEAIMFANHPLSVALSYLGGSPAERGDIKSWLDMQMGMATPGWMVLLLPLSAIFVAWAGARWVNPVLRAHAGQWSRRQMALLSIVKFIVGAVAAGLVAMVVGLMLTHLFGWDPRGSVVGTYVQRNALVVGFVMGFAIIPIIYTIAEDALAAVPEHLRAASLGAGGTPWQTATRIVIPTAMSGLFSAVMIGIGRAVGETMIVLMAAGNTAVTEINPFNGFRTLSANIAVELPEAVVGSTHYRTLYMAALVLFVITFLLNTAAESIRLRFRKRAFQL